MARRPVLRLVFFELRNFGPAFIGRIRATRMEPASGRRIHRRRDIPLQYNTLPAAA